MSSSDEEYENEYVMNAEDMDDYDDEGVDTRKLRFKGPKNNKAYESEDDDEGLEDDGDDSDDDAKVTAWGSQKKRFYQEGDDASNDEAEEEEEKEAKLIEKLQHEKLNQEDFFEVFGEQKTKKDGDEEEEEEARTSLKDRLKSMESLAESDKLALIQKESPELLSIINQLKISLKEVKYKFLPLITYFKTRKNENKEGQRYIELKFNLLMSYCMSLSYYILLNIQGKFAQDHPVIKKLVSTKTLLAKLKPLDKKLSPEILQLLKNIKNGKENTTQKKVQKRNSLTLEEATNLKYGQKNLFGDSKIQSKLTKKALKGEIPAQKKVKENGKTQEKASKKVELGKRGRDQLEKKNKKSVSFGDLDLEDEEEDYEGMEEDMYAGYGDDGEQEEEEDDYYKKVKAVKKIKKEKITTEKQLKNAEEFEEKPSHYVGEDDVRNINRKILKNKGLVRRRPKKNRNSRIKHREAYDKAMHKQVSKRNFVREKGDYYGGEKHINPGIIRSTKYVSL